MKNKLFLMATVLMVMIQTTLFAFTDGGLRYRITSANQPYTVSVEGFDQTGFTNALVIPQTVTFDSITYTVTAIEPFAFFGSQITSVQLPNTLNTIGMAAFERCSQLTGTLTIPESVQLLGVNAFRGCNQLDTLIYLAVNAEIADLVDDFPLPDSCHHQHGGWNWGEPDTTGNNHGWNWGEPDTTGNNHGWNWGEPDTTGNNHGWNWGEPDTNGNNHGGWNWGEPDTNGNNHGWNWGEPDTTGNNHGWNWGEPDTTGNSHGWNWGEPDTNGNNHGWNWGEPDTTGNNYGWGGGWNWGESDTTGNNHGWNWGEPDTNGNSHGWNWGEPDTTDNNHGWGGGWNWGEPDTTDNNHGWGGGWNWGEPDTTGNNYGWGGGWNWGEPDTNGNNHGWGGGWNWGEPDTSGNNHGWGGGYGNGFGPRNHANRNEIFGRHAQFSYVELGANVAEIHGFIFADFAQLNTIKSNANVPPVLENDAFSGVDDSVLVVVPCGKLTDYQNDASWSLFLNIVEDCATPANAISVNVYPNPATNVVTVNAENIESIRIVDFMGRSLNIQTGGDNHVNISNLQPGVYYLHIITTEGTAVQKFVKR